LLTTVMRFNLASCVQKYAVIGRVILDKNLGSDLETARGGIEKMDDFFASFDVSLKLCQEIKEEDKQYLEQICKMAVNDACNLTNPRSASWRELLEICHEVW
jgi:alcohol dehydrogenase